MYGTKLYQEIAKELRQQGYARTAVVLTGPNAGQRCLWYGDDNIIASSLGVKEFLKKSISPSSIVALERRILGGQEVLVEYLTTAPRLVILGGGHVSLPLARMGKMLDFHVVVVDDRQEFANRERFHEADEVYCIEMEALKRNILDKRNSYYVIITRGHKKDSVVAEQLLHSKAEYIGMIGSKAKVAKTKDSLMKKGFSREQVDSLYSPIGLDIGAETPAEIAISILGEVIQVKSHKKMHCFPNDIYEKLLQESTRGIMATVIAKRGSSPRGVGSRMLVLDDGTILGTIGGGAVEYEAIKRSKEVIDGHNISYKLTDDGDLGMICGGVIDVLFERVGW